MIIKETTERNDANNWVKRRLVEDGFEIIEYEGFTIKNNQVTGFFDRRMFKGIDFDKISEDEALAFIVKEESHLADKIAFANSMNIFYRYVFYSYDPRRIYVYRFENERLYFKKKYDNFCDFIKDTGKIRDLKMTSPLEERGMPRIDHIFRNECGYAWMGNLDGLFISAGSGEAKALIEFQTTKKLSVAKHCNNTWFAPMGKRKGDEQRWKVADIFSQHSGLPLVIIVWSPNANDNDIKYKVVDKIIYSDDRSGRSTGLHYSTKELLEYGDLVLKLNLLINK